MKIMNKTRKKTTKKEKMFLNRYNRTSPEDIKKQNLDNIKNSMKEFDPDNSMYLDSNCAPIVGQYQEKAKTEIIINKDNIIKNINKDNNKEDKKEIIINNQDKKEENINNENNIENDINTKSELKIPKKNKNAKLKKEKPLLTEQPYQKFFLSKDFDLDNCKSLQEQNLFPLFNMQLLYQSLLDRVPPKKCPSFAAERKRTKELMNKIPDPNETWGHFFKRLVNFELYNPPLVDKRNVSQMNSMYMNAQMKLMESEYGIKMSYYDNEGENLDDSKQVGESEEQPILQLKKNKKVEKQKEEEEEPENIIKINVKSVSKTESKNNGNSSVRDKDDFYTVDINNTSGRQINENEKGDDISDKQ